MQLSLIPGIPSKSRGPKVVTLDIRNADGHPSMRSCKIILAEDHVLFRQLVKECLERVDGFTVVGEAEDGVQLLELLETCLPDLIILDIAMPRLQGLEAARKIKAVHPGVKVVILTMHNNAEYLHEAMAAGTDGFLLKEGTDTELVGAIEKVLKGGIYITPLMGTA
jgi:DNA-binding NarL/FixJ family response regulator